MIRLQTTRDSASTLINGIRFAAHPAPPDGGKLLVSEPLDEADERVPSLLGIPGFDMAGDYDGAVLRAVDDAIRAEASAAVTAADAARDQTYDELIAANQNLARTVGEQRREITELKRQIGETAVGELREEIVRLQERLREAESGKGDAEVQAALKAEVETAQRAKADLEQQLAAAKADADAARAAKADLEQQLAGAKTEIEKLAKDAKKTGK